MHDVSGKASDAFVWAKGTGRLGMANEVGALAVLQVGLARVVVPETGTTGTASYPAAWELIVKCFPPASYDVVCPFTEGPSPMDAALAREVCFAVTRNHLVLDSWLEVSRKGCGQVAFGMPPYSMAASRLRHDDMKWAS